VLDFPVTLRKEEFPAAMMLFNGGKRLLRRGTGATGGGAVASPRRKFEASTSVLMFRAPTPEIIREESEDLRKRQASVSLEEDMLGKLNHQQK
jgi:hypothetical protein